MHREAERLLAEGALDSHPTYFETVTAMAFLLFRDLAAETVVLEVGLGGRLDATNVVLPQVSVITPIDYDHEAFLGKSLEAIAGEKAGIIKPGVPVVIGPQRPAVEALLEARAAELGAPVSKVLRVDRGGPPTRRPRQPLRRGGPAPRARRVPAGRRAPGVERADRHRRAARSGDARRRHRRGHPAGALAGPAGVRLATSPKSSSTARTTRPAPGRWLATSSASMPAAASGWSTAPCATRPSARWPAFCSRSPTRSFSPRPINPRAVRPEVIRTLVDHPRVQVAANLAGALALLRRSFARTMPSSSPAPCSWWAKPARCSYNRLLCPSSARIFSSTR